MFNKIRVVVIFIFYAVLITACSASATLECSTSTKSCTIKGTISNKSATSSDIMSFDATQASVQISGDTPVIATNGSISLRLINGSKLVVSSGFGWVRNGSTITFSNPSSVNNWIKSNAKPGYQLEYSLDGIAYSPLPGSNTLETTLYYAGGYIAKASSGWSESGNDWRDEP